MTSRILVIAAFAAAAVCFLVVEWFARRRPESQLPTLATMAGFVMAYEAGRVPVGRIAVYGFWWWLGWHFFAR